MPHRFTRRDLYDLVWSERMSILAARLGLSPAGLKKKCTEADIPFPRQAFWIARQRGRRTVQPPLPERPPAMDDEVVIGPRSDWLTEDEILGPVPDLPTFSESIEEVRARMRIKVGRVVVPKSLAHAHPLITNAVEAQPQRRGGLGEWRLSIPGNEPWTDTPVERRRLRILSSVIVGVGRAGGKPWVDGNRIRDIGAKINRQSIRLVLEPMAGQSEQAAGARLRLSIRTSGTPEVDLATWEDSDSLRLERLVSEIAAEILTQAEVEYRNSCFAAREQRIEWRQRVVEQRARRQQDAERAAHERKLAEERARRERLLAEAESFRSAAEIRAYVKAVRVRCESAEAGERESIARWCEWALAEADCIDPVLTGPFRIDEVTGDDPQQAR